MPKLRRLAGDASAGVAEWPVDRGPGMAGLAPYPCKRLAGEAGAEPGASGAVRAWPAQVASRPRCVRVCADAAREALPFEAWSGGAAAAHGETS